MNYEDVEKISNAAQTKAELLKHYPGKYFIRAIIAGFFIVVAMIFSSVVNSLFMKDAWEWGKFLGAAVFSIAVLLIVMVGGELFTGNNLVMVIGVYDKRISMGQMGKVWLVSYIGNFVGCAVLALIFVGAGASGTADYFAAIIGNKLSIPPTEMFLRAILCNFLVCLAVLCGIKMKSETGKILMVVFCISSFVVGGFEHCIANMGIFVTAYCLVPGLSVAAMLKSMVIVTIGNMIGGAVLLALPLRKMSADK